MQRFLDQLEQQFTGDIEVDDKTLEKYAYDRSIFYLKPQVVVFPRTIDDIKHLVRLVQEFKSEIPELSVTSRAAGTGVSGGSLNDSIIMNVTRYMDGFIDLDLESESKTITVQPGMLYKNFEKRLEGTGYTMPIFPSSREWAAIGGMVGNNAAGENTLKYGAQDAFVESLRMILDDGEEYDISSVTHEELHAIIATGSRLGEVYKGLYDIVVHHEKVIYDAKPNASKNTAGYQLWDILTVPVNDFENGKGQFRPQRIMVGSQGTLGITTEVTYRLMPVPHYSDLLVVPISNSEEVTDIVEKILGHGPEKVELFDDKTLSLSDEYPEDFHQSFFKDDTEYEHFLERYESEVRKRLIDAKPKLVVLAQLSGDDADDLSRRLRALQDDIESAYVVEDEFDQRMYWSIRYSSLSLVANHAGNKMPAAFLEDLVVDIKHFGDFYDELVDLIAANQLECAVHGHAGNVHLHFYPLLDFHDKRTKEVVEYTTQEFFALAEKYKGTISGEHNDGLIRTPFLKKLYGKEIVSLFMQVKRTFDEHNIFNPGKKVRPRFALKDIIRDTNPDDFIQAK